MREQTWYERIINFFCRIFHKDSEEIMIKIKQLFCRHEYVKEKKKIETNYFPYSYIIVHYKRCIKCGKEIQDR